MIYYSHVSIYSQEFFFALQMYVTINMLMKKNFTALNMCTHMWYNIKNIYFFYLMFTINCHAQLYYPLIVSAWPINGWCRLRVAVWSRCPNTTAEIECFLLPIWCRKKNIIIDRNYPMGCYFSFHKVEKNSCFQPVVDGDVTVEVELSMTELDHRKSGSAEGLDFMHSWNTLPQNDCNQLQDFSRSGSGQVNVGQNGVFRTAILRLILSCLLKIGSF